MSKSRNIIMAVSLGLASAACAGIGDRDGEEAPERASPIIGMSESALNGAITFDNSCVAPPNPQTSPSTQPLDVMRNLRISEAYTRIAVNSPAFEQCVKRVMATATDIGGSIEGPYLACDGDPAADQVLNHARSANGTLIRCDYSTLPPGCVDAGNCNTGGWARIGDIDSAGREVITFGNELGAMNKPIDCNYNPDGIDCTDDGDFIPSAQAIGHEIMHTHGYRHVADNIWALNNVNVGDVQPVKNGTRAIELGDFCGIQPAFTPGNNGVAPSGPSANPTPGIHPVYNSSVPYEIGACIAQVLAVSQASTHMHDDCGPNFAGLKLVDTIFGNAPETGKMHCVADPYLGDANGGAPVPPHAPDCWAVPPADGAVINLKCGPNANPITTERRRKGSNGAWLIDNRYGVDFESRVCANSLYGKACAPIKFDRDGDMVPDDVDNCPTVKRKLQWDSNLDAEKQRSQPWLGDACDLDPTTSVEAGVSFQNRLTGPCWETWIGPNGGGAHVLNDKLSCPISLNTGLILSSHIGNDQGNAATATGKTELAVCLCPGDDDCLGATGCPVADDNAFPVPGRAPTASNRWRPVTLYDPTSGVSLYASAVPSKFVQSDDFWDERECTTDDECGDRKCHAGHCDASVMAYWDFTQDRADLGLPADAQSLHAVVWSRVTSFNPAKGEHGIRANLSNSYTEINARISYGQGPIHILPSLKPKHYWPWDAVDPMGWVTWVNDASQPDPVGIVQHAGEAPVSAPIAFTGAASSLIRDVLSNKTRVLMGTDLPSGGAATSSAPFAVTVSAQGAVRGALKLSAGALHGIAAPARAMLSLKLATEIAPLDVADAPAALLAYGAAVGKVFSLDASVGSLDIIDVASALAGEPAKVSLLLQGSTPIAPLAMTWDGKNERLLLLDSRGAACSGADELRLLAVTTDGMSRELWAGQPSARSVPSAAFMTLGMHQEIVVSLSGVPDAGRSEVLVFEPHGKLTNSGDFDAELSEAVLLKPEGLFLPQVNQAAAGESDLRIEQVEHKALSSAENGASWLTASSASAGLSASGTEQCEKLHGASFNLMLELLTTARDALASSDAADARDAVALIDDGRTKLSDAAKWLDDNQLDGTNPSAAMSTDWVMTDVLDRTFRAAKLASQLPSSSADDRASQAFDALAQAAPLVIEQAAGAGRCAMDKYEDPNKSWWDWRLGMRPDSTEPSPESVPSTCEALTSDALKPLTTMMEHVIQYEQAEIDAYPDQPPTMYAQVDRDNASAALVELADLRTWLEVRGTNGSDANAALELFTRLAKLTPTFTASAERATLSATDLPGPGRKAFEADETAAKYAASLTVLAGRCAQSRANDACVKP